MLSDRCLYCLSAVYMSCPVLSVTLVYCGQTVGWIKMPLAVVVGLDPGHVVLNGDLAAPKRNTVANFWPMSVVAKRLHRSRASMVGRQASAQATC